MMGVAASVPSRACPRRTLARTWSKLGRSADAKPLSSSGTCARRMMWGFLGKKEGE